MLNFRIFFYCSAHRGCVKLFRIALRRALFVTNFLILRWRKWNSAAHDHLTCGQTSRGGKNNRASVPARVWLGRSSKSKRQALLSRKKVAGTRCSREESRDSTCLPRLRIPRTTEKPWWSISARFTVSLSVTWLRTPRISNFVGAYVRLTWNTFLRRLPGSSCGSACLPPSRHFRKP